MHITVILPFVIVLSAASNNAQQHANLWQECSKLFHPQNYLDQLPSLSLPYVSNVPLPSVPMIKPTPVITTKVVNVVTKYINRNPVCIRVTSKKPHCKLHKKHSNKKTDQEYVVSKEYYVKDRKGKDIDELIPQHLTIHSGKEKKEAERVITESHLYLEGDEFDLRPHARNFNQRVQDLHLQTSESPRAFTKKPTKTPSLSKKQIQNLLIEDRLDQLEQILPHYTRQRVYQTSTITVTKVLTDNKPTATLLVKNCIPLGIERCPPRKKKRKSKVAVEDIEIKHYYG